jgi:hypothetical protein
MLVTPSNEQRIAVQEGAKAVQTERERAQIFTFLTLFHPVKDNCDAAHECLGSSSAVMFNCTRL